MTKYWYCTCVYGIGHFNTFTLQFRDMYCNRQPTYHTWVEAIHAAAFNCILVQKMRPAFNFLEMKVNAHFASWSCFEREQNGCHKPRQYQFIEEYDIPS